MDIFRSSGNLPKSDKATKHMQTLQVCVDDLFPDIKSDIIQNVKIFDITLWPSDEHLMTEFGNKKVELRKNRVTACLK